MDYSTVAQALEGWFKRPLSKLPRDLRTVVEAYIPKWPELTPGRREERAKEIDRQRGVKLRIKLDRFRRQQKQDKANADPMEERAWGHVGYYGDGHVRLWLGMGSVSAQDAALLLHGENPSTYKGYDIGVVFNDMKKSFDDVARDGSNRNLSDWIAVARERNLQAVCINGWEACVRVLMQNPPGTDATDDKPQGAEIDYAFLATRQQLIDAFGTFTGMNMTWFDNLTDTPSLKAARKVTGQGGRGHIAEPLFCPYEVMQWLLSPRRKKGRQVNSDTAWRMLETHFPNVYSRFSVGDTRAD